jgi:hypothetical protein
MITNPCPHTVPVWAAYIKAPGGRGHHHVRTWRRIHARRGRAMIAYRRVRRSRGQGSFRNLSGYARGHVTSNAEMAKASPRPPLG